MKEEEIKLKVGELSSRDEFGLGIVRLDSSILQKLGIKEGEPIEIENKRKTVAIAYRSYPADKGLNIIRMDGITRKNCGGAIGEYVKVRKPEVKEARRVVIAPATKGTPIISSSYAKRALIGRPVGKGDLISIGRRRSAFYSEFPFPFDIEEFFIPSSENRFIVTNTDPSGFVIITEETEIEVLKEVPEILKEGKVPTVTYEDIGGIKPIIEKVREMIELPLRHPELFDRLGIDAPKGILLYGPPGTGKTLLAKAVANESGANFIAVSGPEFLSKFYGESEANLRKIFEEAEKTAPSIIFFDEIDAIAPKREEVTGEVERRIVSTLLTLMDGLKSRGKVVVIAATNRPNSVDPALRRPGRFDREIEFPVPDTNGRYEILVIHTRNMPINPFEKTLTIEELSKMKKDDLIKKISKIDDEIEIREIIYKELDKEESNNLEKSLREKILRKLAEMTHGYVGADLAALAREAAMSALRRVLPQIKWKEEEKLSEEELSKIFVTWRDFENALKMVEPSAMREVLVEVPKVKWEDIGGLEEVKKTLREMIEWPLKYRESFERIGIEPPKGILLYGPPGTGKTLLAKAVANESGANFIAVKGPELLSKWFGESLPYNENVLIIENGIPKFEKIYKIVEKKNGENIIAPTITDDFNAKNSKVINYFKHIAPPYLYIIKTETGREVKVTGDHSLFTKWNGELKEVKAEFLIPRESRIAIPRKLIAPESINSINILDFLRKNDYNLYIRNHVYYTNKAVKKIGRKKAAKILGIKERDLYYYLKGGALRVSKFLKLMEISKTNFNPKKLKISSYFSVNQIPALFEFSEEFCTFLGLWVAEGAFLRKTSLRLSISKKETEIKKLIQKLFGHVTVYNKGNGTDIIISSKVLRIFLEKILGLKSGAKNKRVPPIVFGLSLRNIAAFLRGYFGGDGYVGKRTIEVSTISKRLANDILTLLLYFGIVARYYRKKEWNGTLSYRICITWSKFMETFVEKIGFIDNEKNYKIKNYLKSIHIKRNKLSPERFIEKDIYWDLVVEKKKVPYNFPYVYDIGINPTERFIAGFGCVLVHNSEQRIRELFRRARQVAPAIIFFDEIDALAPRRGYALHEATERIVSQLLTEMSGITDIKNVVIIAATNRPDLVDPALLRPGRFDKLIFIPPPDKQARLEILKIHTKNMPLAKDVDLEEIASKTENYSGADLEALVKEAAMSALREDINAKEVKKIHFEEALKKIGPSLTKEMIEYYKKFEERKKSMIEERGEKEEQRYIG
ncbi:MAG: AAA family ATPase [Candidatus Aenigmatarchaeota archaeon]